MQDSIVPLNPPSADLESLIEKTRALVRKSRSANTVRGYRSDWADWTAWAAAHHASALPADPGWLALYLADRSSTLRAASLARRLNAISFYHRAKNLESPTYHPLVRATFRGIKREIGTAQTFKRGLLSPEIRRIVDHCPKTLAGLRDKALLLISYAAMTRRSETAALKVEDIAAAEPDGIIVTVSKSKVDVEAAGRKVGIPYFADETTCPIRALQRYREAAGIVSGFVFRAIDQKGRVSPFGLHSDSVGYIIKRATARARLTGVNIEDVAGHSLRSGGITQASRNGVPEYLIRRQSGHKPGSKTFDRYIRLGEMFTKNAASGLGL